MLYAVHALRAAAGELSWHGVGRGAGVEVRGDERRGDERGEGSRRGEERDAYLLLLFVPTWRRGEERD